MLEGLMAKYRMTQSDIAEISGLSLPGVSSKFAKGEDFKITHAAKIAKHFREHGEEFNFEDHFVDPVVANETTVA